MSMFKEFKDFAMKGNLVDIAVGFVMGVAFKSVVTSFTGGIVSPLIGLIFKTDFKDLKWVIEQGIVNDAGKVTGEVAILYGEFFTNIIDFTIIAFVMFMIIKGINNLKKKEEPVPSSPKGPTQEDLLTEIRDLLSKK
ncbi:MAG: large conductance mechanosensitive channel protein MscL [Lutibacter sp.]|nr:MAG: large conductance mechanosensitive channel protein MscL [Lutibacter sp.]